MFKLKSYNAQLSSRHQTKPSITPNEAKKGSSNSLAISNSTNRASENNSVITTKKSESSVLNQAAHFFQGTDGWDELGSALGQILPGIGQHIATLSFLSVLSPAVYLGIKGMATEYEEAHASIHAATLAKQALIDKIIEVFDLKIDPDIFKDGAKSFKHFIKTLEKHKESNPSDFEKKAMLLTEYSDALKHENAAKIGYDAAPLGVFAMSGMFAGMMSAVSTSAIEIAQSANPTIQGLEVAASAGEAVTSGIFIPAQAMMVAYSLMKYSQGQSEKAIKQFDKDQVNEFKNTEPEAFSSDFYEAIQDNLDRQIAYIHREKVVYGAGLAASETGMMTGTILGLTPASPVGLGILIPSALSTIGFAGLRIHAGNKQGKFTGHAHDHIHNGNVVKALKNSTKHTLRRITNSVKNSENQTPIPTPKSDPDSNIHIHNHSSHQMSNGQYDNKTIEQQFDDATSQLADYKNTSILLESLSSKKSVDEMMRTGRKSSFRQTTIQKDVLAKMKEMGVCGTESSCLKMKHIPEHQRRQYQIDFSALNQNDLAEVLNNKEKKIHLLQALSLNLVLSDPANLLKDLFSENDSAIEDYNTALREAGFNEKEKKRIVSEKYTNLFLTHLDNEDVFQALKPHINRVLINKHLSNKQLKKVASQGDSKSLSRMRNIDMLRDICQSLVRENKGKVKQVRQKAINEAIFVAKYKNMMRQSSTESSSTTITPHKSIRTTEPANISSNLFIPQTPADTGFKDSNEESKVEIDSPGYATDTPSFAAGFASLLNINTDEPKQSTKIDDTPKSSDQISTEAPKTEQNVVPPKPRLSSASDESFDRSTRVRNLPNTDDVPVFAPGFSALLKTGSPKTILPENIDEVAMDNDPRSIEELSDTTDSKNTDSHLIPVAPVDLSQPSTKTIDRLHSAEGSNHQNSTRPGIQKIIDEARRIKDGEGTPTRDPARLKIRERIRNNFQDFVALALKIGIRKA